VAWLLGPLTGGRRLLSDDLALAESAAFMAGRRLDALRVADERFAATLREQQISRLATEAELRALRAQLNPHFLFNALTTIGYLIQTAPTRAHATLLRLTSLLRGVLRRTTSEFASLGEEVELVQAYLEIEEARFEERLRVRIDVPSELRPLRVPSLLLQPIVENAVKHGIAPLAAGGDVEIVARLAPAPDAPDPARTGTLHLVVRDTGIGTSPAAATAPRQGLGIASVERRLRTHYGERARLTIAGVPEAGTRVEIVLPVTLPHPVGPSPALSVG
jgi:LytS/YehU family sensor histidine kinase